MTYPKGFEGMVNCIYHDKAGFIWIGKESGLLRYDGYEVKGFGSNPSDSSTLGGNNVTAIVEDPSGDLWIGTRDGGLNRYNRKQQTFTRYLHHPQKETSISSDQVTAICADGKGNYLVGTDGGGLNFFNPKTGQFRHYKAGQKNFDGLKSNKILSIVPGGKDKFWLGTWGGGVCSFNNINKAFTQLGKGTAFAKLNVFSMLQVKPGVLWIGTFADNLYSYTDNTGKFSTVLKSSNNNSVTNLAMNRKGQIYISTYGGLYYAPSATSSCISIADPSGTFHSLNHVFIDKAQSLWLANRLGDVGKIDFLKERFHRLKPNNPFWQERIYSVATFGSHLYLRTSKSFVEYNTLNGKYSKFPSLLQHISPMTEIKETSSIFFSSREGLMEFNHKNKKLSPIKFIGSDINTLLPKGVMDIYSSKSGVWIGGNEATFLLLKDRKTGNWTVHSRLKDGVNGFVNPHYVTCFLERPNGDLWLGTWGSALNVRKAGKTEFVNLERKSSGKNVSDNFVECLAADSKGNIWIGTLYGLNKYDIKTGKYQNLGSSDGLADEYINNIEIDRKDRVWVTTRKGISCISNDLKRIRNYDKSDGLPWEKFGTRASTTHNNGTIYFGSEKGPVWFHPDSLYDNPYLAVPAIVDFKIKNKSIPIEGSSPLPESIENINSIHLKAEQNTFSFQLASLSYFNVKRNRMAYKLEGYDTHWLEAGENQTADYSDIPAGEYTFLVKASNEDGVWNPQVKRLTLAISPPLWFSAWAFVGYAIVLSGLAYGFVRFKKRSIGAPVSSGLQEPKRRVDANLIQPSSIESTPTDLAYLQKAIAVVEENMSNESFGVQEFSQKMNQSQRQVSRRMNEVAGVTIAEFIKELRLKRAAQLLSGKSANVSEVAYSVGFTDPKYFSKCFKQQFGVSPMQYKG